MTIINKVNAVQASTNTSVVATDATMQTSYGTAISYTIVNTGDDTISWILYGANASDLSDKVIVKASADVLAAGVDSYSNSLAPFEYYGIFIKSKVDNTPGEATIRGILKG